MKHEMSELSKRHTSQAQVASHINTRSRLSAQPAPNNNLVDSSPHVAVD